MPRISTAGAALALLTLSLSTSLNAQPAASAPAEPAATQSSATQQSEQLPGEDAARLEAESRQAYQDGEYLRFYIANMKLHKMLPYVPQYMYDIVRACALLEKPQTAYHYMLKMQQQGLAYDFNETEDSQNIRNTQAYDYINNMMIEAGKPAGEGAVAMTLDGDPSDFQAMAWDASRNRLLVGTVSEGKLLAADADGNAEVLLRANAENGLWSVNGLAVDERRNRLWVSSSSTPRFAGHSETEGNRSALFEFELGSLALVARHDLPADGFYHELGGVSLSDDGHVYVADTLMPMIYRKLPQQTGLQPFVASRGLVAFTDVAVTPDNRRLYAADPVTGVFTVDLAAESASMLSGPETVNLAGIQSLDYANGKLLVIQAGIRPERVVRLELEADGLAVANVVPMAIALEAYDRPGGGAVVDTDLYYFANRAAVEGAAGSIVMRTRLDAGSAIRNYEIEDLQKLISPQEQGS